MKAAVVLTTINVPLLLNGYADNFEKYGHKNEAGFIVIGDLKTPREAGGVVDRIRDRGFEAEYWDISAQEEWLRSFPDLKEVIPYNSDNRRNIGYLLAAERGAEIIVSIDDDNYALADEDYLAAHKIVGSSRELKAARSANGWFNICRLLTTDPPRTIYPRGFPYYKRWSDTAEFTTSSGRIVMNAGLWLRDPDVDAVTNLNEPVKVVSISRESIMLAPGVYTAINTQNTALHRDVLPCYYYVVMGASIKGSKVDRYGDIWSGLFAQKVINHLNERIAVGPPAANHIRNKHNLLNDLQQELWGMILTEYLVPTLDSIELTATTYDNAYLELAQKLEQKALTGEELAPEVKSYFQQIAHAMRVWTRACQEVMK